MKQPIPLSDTRHASDAHSRRLGALVLVLCVLSLAACAGLQAQASSQAPRIYDVAAGRYITEATLADRLAAARYRLLGEVHDNAAHHAIRAELIRAIGARGKRPAVVLELFDLEHEDALRAAQAGGAVDAEALASAGALDRRSWSWPLHQPIVDAALSLRLPIHAGNLARALLQRAMRDDAASAQFAAWRERLAAMRWSDAQQAALVATIDSGHCGTLPADLVPRIARSQRLRDAAMAQATVDAANADGSILIAGNGHVRRDIGVPAYMAAAAPATIISVALVEAPGAELALQRPPAAVVEGYAAFDYVWLTSTIDRDDPCERLRRAPVRN